MVLHCPLCRSFAATTYKGVLRHLGTVHAHEARFHVQCDFPGCPRTYTNYHSYKTHLYRKHREFLLGHTPPNTESDDSIIEVDTGADNSGDSCSVQQVTLPAISRTNVSKREAALFTLKAKHVHKISQMSLDGVLCDFTTMLELTVRHLEGEVTAILGTNSTDCQTMQQVRTLQFSNRKGPVLWFDNSVFSESFLQR